MLASASRAGPHMLVIDSSVLIDLVHAGIDGNVLAAWRIEAPDLMVQTELEEYGDRFQRGGLIITSLTPAEVQCTRALVERYGHAQSSSKRQQRKALSWNDCSVLALAKSRERVMLVADRALRDVAAEHQVEAHGVLWLLDLMDQHHVLERPRLVAALEIMLTRPRARLPHDETQQLLGRWRER